MRFLTSIIFLLMLIISIDTFGQHNRNIYDLDIDSSCYVIPEEQASFQGGDIKAFSIYIQNNLIIPSCPDTVDIATKICFDFDIDWNGQIQNIKIKRSLGYKQFDKELIKLLKDSPKWVPATNKGKRVCQSFEIMINIEIQE